MIRKDLKAGLIIGFTLILVATFWFGIKNPVRLNSSRVQTDSFIEQTQTEDISKPQNQTYVIDTQTVQTPESFSADNKQKDYAQSGNTSIETTPENIERVNKTKPIKFHIVKQGETLSSISEFHYKTSKNWKIILDANRDVLSNPDKLKAGMKLIIPELESQNR